MKKILALMLVCIMVMAALPMALADDQVTLTFWTQDTQPWLAYFEPALARFHEANPNIKVNVEYFSSFADKLTQSFGANTQADVIFTYSSVGEWAKSGKLAEVPESCYTTEELETLFYAGAMANKIVDGKYFAVSDEINVESPSLYVNMDILEKEGVQLPAGWLENDGPATWTELFDFAKSLTVKNSSGVVTRAGLSYAYAQWEAMFESLIWQYGGEFRDPENLTVHFETEEARKALEFMLGHLGTGEDALCSGTGNRYDEFVQGTAVMCVGAPWYAGGFDGDMPDTKYQVFNLPAFVEGADPISLATGGWAYIVSSKCANPDAAWQFVKFMTSGEEVGEWALTTGALPSRGDALKDLDYDNDKGSVTKAIAIASKVLPFAQEDGAYMLTSSTLTYSIIRQALYTVLDDGDIDTCLETIQQEAETMLEENFEER